MTAVGEAAHDCLPPPLPLLEPLMTATTQAPPATAQPAKRRFSRDRVEEAVTGYLFVLPDLLGLLVFVVGPMLYALYISLNRWSGFTAPTFIGLENYIDMAGDPRFWASLRRTFLWTLGLVPTVYVFSLALALLVNRNPRGSTLFRTVYFMPVAMSLVVAAIVWRFIFEPTYGFLNYVLGLFGIEGLLWLGSRDTAMISVLIVTVWKSAGYFMIILLAGIQDIPNDFIEAARIDGANSRQIFQRIIMPLLRPTSLFVIIILLINSLQAFDQIYVMTRGGPAYATDTLLMYVYEEAFRFWNFGYSAAMSFVLFLLILVITVFQLRFFRDSNTN
jgi:multiple sugar transport system permease protein